MDKEKISGLYIGPKKIKVATTCSDRTYLGKEKIVIKFDDESTEEFPVEALSYIITKEKTDLTTLALNRVKPIAEKIMEILVESELKKEDMEYLINNVLLASLNDALNRANIILWGGKEAYQITLADMEKVLKKHGGSKKRKS